MAEQSTTRTCVRVSAAACASRARCSRATRRPAATSFSCRTRRRRGRAAGARRRARRRRRQIARDRADAGAAGPGGRAAEATRSSRLGRPFVLGELRLEIFASGLMPGSASLLCERDGRRIVYAGPIGAGAARGAGGGRAVPRRHASARRRAASRRAQALAAVGAAVRDALARGHAPSCWSSRWRSRWPSRPRWPPSVSACAAHRDVVWRPPPTATPGCRSRRCSGSPAASRPGEALLWPAREPPRPARRGRARTAHLVSAEPGRARLADGAPTRASRFPTGPTCRRSSLRRGESGRSEVALVNAPGRTILPAPSGAGHRRLHRGAAPADRSVRRGERPAWPDAARRLRATVVLNFPRVQSRDGRDHRHPAPRPDLPGPKKLPELASAWAT